MLFTKVCYITAVSEWVFQEFIWESEYFIRFIRCEVLFLIINLQLLFRFNISKVLSARACTINLTTWKYNIYVVMQILNTNMSKKWWILQQKREKNKLTYCVSLLLNYVITYFFMNTNIIFLKNPNWRTILLFFFSFLS